MTRITGEDVENAQQIESTLSVLSETPKGPAFIDKHFMLFVAGIILSKGVETPADLSRNRGRLYEYFIRKERIQDYRWLIGPASINNGLAVNMELHRKYMTTSGLLGAIGAILTTVNTQVGVAEPQPSGTYNDTTLPVEDRQGSMVGG